MGKKYIIELKDNELLYKTTIINDLPYIHTVLAKPYTEPDLEQVRKEAYDKGFEDGKELCPLPEVCHNNAYQKGLSDAWEAARKIANMPYGEEEKAFGSGGWAFVEKHTASEAIEKIRQYEQEKEFKVGDEFENESGKKFVVLKMNGKEIDRYIDSDGKTYLMSAKYTVMRKTGRHFSEIASVLEQMRGDNND